MSDYERVLSPDVRWQINNVFRYRIRLVVWPALIAMALAAAWIGVQHARYTATATVLLDARRGPGLSEPAIGPVDAAVIETQIELLRSDKLIGTVAERLQMASRPEYSRTAGFTRLLASIAPRALSLNDPVRVVDVIKRDFAVVQAGRGYVAHVSFTARDPALAAAFANSAADAYIEEILAARASQAVRAGAWMIERLDKLRPEVTRAEQAVESFKMEQPEVLSVGHSGTGTADALSASRARLRALESHAHAYKSIYETFLSRTAQSVQQQSFPISDARIVSPAQPPLQPSAPRSALLLMLAGLFGGAVGFLAAFAKEQTNPLVGRPEPIEALGVPVIGNIPRTQGFAAVPKRSGIRPLMIDDRTDALRKSQFVIDEFARFGRTDDSAATVIGIISGTRGEGRTTIAYNLAALLAESNRVALVDWDLRRPDLTAEFGLGQVPSTPEDVRDDLGFSFLPAPDNEGVHPSVVLSRKAADTMATLRKDFDYVVVDLPSLEQMDALPVINEFDALLLVVATGKSSVTPLARALQSSKPLKSRVAGALLNHPV